MKKIFRKLHLWLSIPFGLIIAIICFSGAALVFETEIMELSNRDRYFVKEVKESAIPVDELLTAVGGMLPDSVSITSVKISSDPRRAYQVGVSVPHRASVFIDQYTGEIKEYYTRPEFFTVTMRLHRWLLDSMRRDGSISVGKLVVGISTIVFVVVLITGIIIWIPRNRKALKNKLKISARRGWKRFLYDIHVAGGMYALILLLAMALTGLTWSFSWYRTGFYKVFGVETQQTAPRQGEGGAGGRTGQPAAQESGQRGASGREGERGQRGGGGQTDSSERGRRGQGEGNSAERGVSRPDGEAAAADVEIIETPVSPYAVWQQVYDQVSVQISDYNSISLSKGAASVAFDRWGNQRASDRYTFDAVTGEVTNASLYKDQPKSGKIRGWIYSVHVGSWGGLFSKIITFLAAVWGGTLPLTGYYLWIKRSINKRNSRRRKAAAQT